MSATNKEIAIRTQDDRVDYDQLQLGLRILGILMCRAWKVPTPEYLSKMAMSTSQPLVATEIG